VVLRGGKLLAGPPEALTDDVRAVIAANRPAILGLLLARQQENDSELAAILDLLDRVTRETNNHAGRALVLEVFEGLARRWHSEADAKLFEVREVVTELLQRWNQEDTQRNRAGSQVRGW
jgi:hypothetical protein